MSGPRGHAPVELGPADPEHQALLADSVGRALLAVFASLSPTERVATLSVRIRRHDADGAVDRLRQFVLGDLLCVRGGGR